MIALNKIYRSQNELKFMEEALDSGKTSGNGKFTKLCQQFFEERFGYKKALLTTSCTDALEMCAFLAELKPGDEVIIPSYTFVSTALPFLRMGAEIIFADSAENNPNIDATQIESLITQKTKVIVVVHYAGISCDMDAIMEIAKKHNILVVEDAAQAIDSWYTGKDGLRKALGSIGHFGAISFHDTKNIICGEGGLLTINDEKYIKRSEVIWEKGTNRAEFFRGEVNKYGWIDLGSSFLPSEITAAYLWSQLQELEIIEKKRRMLWDTYFSEFSVLKDSRIKLPDLPDYAEQNGHLFYILAENLEHRTKIVDDLKIQGFQGVFHYMSLHGSAYYKDRYFGKELPNSDHFTDCLLRLPLYYELEAETVKKIVNCGVFS